MSSKKNSEMYRNAIITKTKEYFIEQARQIWGDRYDYTDSEYTNGKKPIMIYCPKHDYHFRVAMAQNHIMKPNGTFKPTGCPICAAEKRHGCEYDKDWRKHLKLCTKRNCVRKIESHRHHRLDPEEVARRKAERKAKADAAREQRKAQRWQAYQERLQQQKEQTRLRHEAKRQERQRQREKQERQRILDLQDRFRKEAPLKQGEGYIYKGIEQITSVKSKVMVHCPNPDHEWHPMLVDLCLQGCKCRECAVRHQPVEQRREKFRRQVIKKHGTKRFRVAFDEYVNNDTPISVHCMEHHYDYKTSPDNLLRGAGGCPYCSASEGEAVIKGWLDNHDIPHEWHAQIPNEDPTLPLQYVEADFWIAHLNLYIEYHGQQHYEDVGYFYKGKKIRNFAVQQHRDRYLRNYCQHHGHNLLEIPYWDFHRIDEILKAELLNINI